MKVKPDYMGVVHQSSPFLDHIFHSKIKNEQLIPQWTGNFGRRGYH